MTRTRNRPRAPRALGLALLLPSAVLGGCTGVADRDADRDGSGWPAPDPGRPVVELAYVFGEDHAQVEGTERITFTPDLAVCEVVLRAWPNKPYTALPGNALTVEQVRVDGEQRPLDEQPAGAPEDAPGTLVEVPLQECASAGDELALEVDFTVTLGEGTDERLGRDGDLGLAWLGTAYPVLAWQPGVGWAREDAVPVAGEMTTSAAFELAELAVTVPAGQEVAGVGERGEVSTGDDGSRTARFSAPAMRDVAVTVGEVDVHDRTADGVAIHLVVPRGMEPAEVEEWADVVTGTLAGTVELLGPYPYPSLWVSLLPVTEGIELTGAVQIGLGDPEQMRWLVAHELAHQWFYGLVGSNQGAEPWLDEAWASAVQELVAPMGWEPGGHEVEGALGWSMGHWAQVRDPDRAYVDTVYTGGGRLLTELREQVGAPEWDAAVRDYLAGHAHTIATPQDLREALADLPGVDEALTRGGAWEE